MDISAAIQEYLLCKENALTHDTYHWYQWILGVFEKWCKQQGLLDLKDITPGVVQHFVSAEPSLSENTKHHRAQVVKGFLRWCAEDDMGVREKTVKRIEMPKVSQPEVEIFTNAQIRRLLEACARTRYPLRNRAILLLLLDTGIRAAECCFDNERPEERTGLLLENVVIGTRGSESYIIIMGKGRKLRTVKIGRETRLALQKYINHERPRTDHSYVFVAMGGSPFAVHGLQTMLSGLGESTHIENVHPHRFRHTFAINQLLAGTSPFVLMQLLGHSSLEATKVYLRALTQMQARQASVSVVDEFWKAPREDEGMRARMRKAGNVNNL